jgi:hypothetical protein
MSYKLSDLRTTNFFLQILLLKNYLKSPYNELVIDIINFIFLVFQ